MRLPDGGYAGDIEPHSEKDVVSYALKNMLNLNNEVFSSIISSLKNVASGARDISSDAERLAQGSSEQAVTIQELSSSIQDVSTQAHNNAQMASDGDLSFRIWPQDSDLDSLYSERTLKNDSNRSKFVPIA